MKVKPTPIRLFSKQLEFYRCQDHEALLEAGIGYGKSRVASIWLAEQVWKYPNTKWIMAARDYKQLKKSIDPEFEYYMNDILGVQYNKHYTKVNGSPIEYRFKNGSVIYGMGAHNYDTNFRSGNYSGCWGDEVDYWKPEAMQALRGRIRVYPELKRFTSSPKGFNHIYEDFYTKKVGKVFNAPSTENLTLSSQFLNSLKDTYTERLYEQEVLAKRLNITQGRCYYAFNREDHVKEFQRPNGSMFIGQDFNIDPNTAVIAFHQNDCLFVWDEVFLRNSDTYQVAKELTSRGYVGYLYPDSTGGNRRTSGRSDHDIMREAGFTIKYNRNPHVLDRINNLNRLFVKLRIFIHPRCKHLISDLEMVAWKDGKNEIDKTSNHLITHMSDSLGYIAWGLMPIEIKIAPGAISRWR